MAQVTATFIRKVQRLQLIHLPRSGTAFALDFQIGSSIPFSHHSDFTGHKQQLGSTAEQRGYMQATHLLKKQHREVKRLFGQAKKATGSDRRIAMDEISAKLAVHMMIEEEIFYPAVREVGTKKANEIVPEAYEEHHVVKLVLAELPKVDLEDDQFEAKVTVLDELIEHHVEEEEEEIFAVAEKLGPERLAQLGREMQARGELEAHAPD